jgi:hypothetical protein
MKHQDKPDKATLALERTQRDMIEALEFIFDWLDNGKSFAELAIELDIAVAAGALPESSHEYFRLGFEVIKSLRDEGADRNGVMTSLREKQRNTPPMNDIPEIQ